MLVHVYACACMSVNIGKCVANAEERYNLFYVDSSHVVCLCMCMYVYKQGQCVANAEERYDLFYVDGSHVVYLYMCMYVCMKKCVYEHCRYIRAHDAQLYDRSCVVCADARLRRM